MYRIVSTAAPLCCAFALLVLPFDSPLLAQEEDATPRPVSDEPATAQPEEGAAPGGPRWALGMGAGVAYLPDYVGADEGRVLPLPIPYVEYESRYFQADRSGLAGVLPLRDDLRLEVSIGGALPVNSDDNDARKGMPDLSWIGEMGPVLKYRAWEADEGANRITLEVPVRAAFAVGWGEIEHIGWTSSPAVEYRHQTGLRGGRLRATTTLGPLFNSGRYDAYFYEVKERYARPGRPEHHTDAGYAGARAGLGLSYRIGDWWFGAFTRYINLRGAVFEDSPLVRTNHYLSAGIGTAWIFASSDDD
jgi:outer membrane scaffolding protein for murein synthesis (MipA/OmpV family)